MRHIWKKTISFDGRRGRYYLLKLPNSLDSNFLLLSFIPHECEAILTIPLYPKRLKHFINFLKSIKKNQIDNTAYLGRWSNKYQIDEISSFKVQFHRDVGKSAVITLKFLLNEILITEICYFISRDGPLRLDSIISFLENPGKLLTNPEEEYREFGKEFFRIMQKTDD